MLLPKVKIQKSADFTFAVGKIRVWEAKLLPASAFYQLADCADFTEIESILNATSYGRKITSADFDEAINTEEIAMLNELKRFLKDNRFILPFFYRIDFHNLKLIAKSKFTGVEAGWLREGLLKKEIADKIIAEQDFTPLPKTYRDLINQAWEAYDKSNDWQDLDMLFDKSFYGQILKITEEFPFENCFFRTEIDLVNIKTLIRYKNQNAEAEFFIKLLVGGGLLDESFFVEMYKESIDKFSDRLKVTPYHILSDRGIAHFKNKGEFYKIEQDCCLVLLKYLSCAKYTAFGYEPILRYIFLKLNELKNLRTAFVSKLHSVEPEQIKERIGPFNA